MDDIDQIVQQFIPDNESALDQTSNDNLSQQKSIDKYMTAYNQFYNWRINNQCLTITEDSLVTYFEELSKTLAPPSLYAKYSMLKMTLNLKEGVDIGIYQTLANLLKQKSKGYQIKRSKAFTDADMEKFLTEAPDSKYLATKVAFIFGILGNCRREDITNVKKQDVQNHGSMLLVKLPNTKSNTPRFFTIDGKYYDIVMKYRALRPRREVNDRFFLAYREGKCTAQPIGINTIGAMPKIIAEYLKLPDAHLYNSHSFRHSSAIIMSNSGANVTIVKQRGGWTATDGSTKNRIPRQNKRKFSDLLAEEINLQASTSNDNNGNSNENFDIGDLQPTMWHSIDDEYPREIKEEREDQDSNEPGEDVNEENDEQNEEENGQEKEDESDDEVVIEPTPKTSKPQDPLKNVKKIKKGNNVFYLTNCTVIIN